MYLVPTMTRAATIFCLLVALSSLGLVAAGAPASAQPAPVGSWPVLAPRRHSKLAPDLEAVAEGRQPRPAVVPGANDRAPVVEVSGTDPSALSAAIASVGGQLQTTAASSLLAAVPAQSLPALADDPRVASVTLPRRPSIAAVDEGVQQAGASAWQAADDDGAGVKIGILDVGFAGLAAAQSSGALPTVTANALSCGGTMNGGGASPEPHGVAVAEIVHQMAPAASLYLACITYDNQASAAEQWFATNGVTIVNASIGDPLDGRGDGTGDATTLAGAVAAGQAAGQLWTVAAGNGAQAHDTVNAVDADGDGALEMAPGTPLAGPDPTETATFTLPSLPSGATIDIGLKWDAWPTTTQEFEVCVWRGSVSGSFLGCQDHVSNSAPVVEWTATGEPAGIYTYAILRGPTTTASNQRMDIYFRGDEQNPSLTDTAGSVWEPATSPSAMAVGAYDVHNSVIEPFSSRGPTIDGRMKPDISGPDDVSSDVYQPFFGTSAAAPHVAGAAALVKERYPAASAQTIELFLECRADDIGVPGFDNQYGAGTLTMGDVSTQCLSSPFGSLDVATAGPASVTAGGWAIDPDTTLPIVIHAYVDGHGMVLGTASVPRPDVATFFPNYGPDHGYAAQLTGIAPGQHTVCTYGINVGIGVNSLLGCKSFTVLSGPPFGSLDVAQAGPASVFVAGWAIDPDTTSSTTVHVYVDGHGFVLGPASHSRPDVQQVFPGYGDQHGFDAQLTGIAAGQHQVCAYGINIGAGGNSLLGCKSVTVLSGSPFGSLDLAKGGTGSVFVAGWAIDPDTTSSIAVHVYVDGLGFVLGPASLLRPDVAAVLPGYGAAHGFNAQLTGVAPGQHTVCAYGIDVGPGQNNAVGCATTTVK